MIKKGFTLVELLAVFVVISIISMITVPKVFNWISKGESSALQVSTRQIYKAGNEYRLSELRTREEKCVYFSFSENYETETLVDEKMYIPINELELKGDLPTEGEMEVCIDYVNITVSDGDSTVTIDPEGNDKVLDGSLEDNNISRPVIDDLDVLANKDTISVTVTAHDDKNDIVKYYYYLDGKLKHSGDETSYSFDSLTPGNSYKVKVEVENSLGFKTSKTVIAVTIGGVSEPVIVVANEDEWKTEKQVTISYPEGNYTYEYQVTEGTTKENVDLNAWKTATQTQNITFTSNGSIKARVKDGEDSEKELKQKVEIRCQGAALAFQLYLYEKSWKNGQHSEASLLWRDICCGIKAEDEFVEVRNVWIELP